MKKMLTLFLMLSIVTIIVADVFITELADPNNATGARYVELYNNGASSVDLSTGWDLQRWTNGNSSPQAAVELTGTIAAGGFYIVCNNQSTFTSTYGFAADQNIGAGGPADSNGDDQIALRNSSDTIVDMFGVAGEDGSGTNHEFEDGRAERVATVTTGNTTYTFSEWSIWNDTGGSGTTNDPQDAPADFDPASWIGASSGSTTTVQFSPGSTSVSEGVGTYNLTLIITNEDATNATTCNVALTTGDAADVNSYTTQAVTFPAGSSANQTVTVTVTDDSSYEGTEVLTFSIQSVAGGNSAAVGSVADFDLTIEDNDAATTTIPYSEAFAADLGDCYTYSVSGATKDWYQTSGYAKMSGYDSGDTEEDWLILPGINLDNYSNEIMTFDSYWHYGTDDANNYLKLYYSTNYSGIGNPTSSTWTELSYTQGTDAKWTGSGNIDLSAISGTSVWLGFKYHGTDGSYRTWQIDNLSIAEVSNIAPTIASIVQTPASNIGTSTTVSVSADVTDSDGTISSVELHWGTTSGSLGTTISMSNGGSGDTYTTSTNIPAQSEGTTVYYEVYAVDNGSANATSDEASYFVTDASTPNVGDIYISELSDEISGNSYMTAFMEICNTTSNPIDMENSYIERWSSDGNYDGYTYTFASGVVIPADGTIVVARGADQTTFETAWGIDFSSINSNFDAGNTSLYFVTGRSYKLYSPSGKAELDSTPTVSSGNRATQTSSGIWSSESSSSNGTPGQSNDPLPIILSDFYAEFAANELAIVWVTQSEENLNGWNIYKSNADNFEASVILNADLIIATGTSTQATNYRYIDETGDAIEGETYYYWLESIDHNGASTFTDPISYTIPENNNPDSPDVNAKYGLAQNYPNPFNPSTEIKFRLDSDSNAKLEIYNIKGQKVATLFDGFVKADQEITEIWNANTITSGVYFCKLTSGGKTFTKKMILMK